MRFIEVRVKEARTPPPSIRITEEAANVEFAEEVSVLSSNEESEITVSARYTNGAVKERGALLVDVIELREKLENDIVEVNELIRTPPTSEEDEDVNKLKFAEFRSSFVRKKSHPKFV